MSTLSGGFDYKNYNLATTKGSFDIFVNSTTTNTFTNAASVNAMSVQYLPMSLGWDAHRADGPNSTDFSFGYTVNFSGAFFHSRTNFQSITGSPHGDGYYQILTGSLGRDQMLFKNWRLSLRADGQWANQPLISNEQFGVGGLNGVRGYREGEVFGDTGWRIISELKTPPHVVGEFGGVPGGRLTVRASFFMDYAETYLLDPEGRRGETPLLGTGIAGAASIGHNWEARLMFSLPLLNTPTTEADQFLVNFSLSAQF
jgi:hemolysin activation/secretion protein